MIRAREAMADVADNTEALKRNWLFRGYFAERGFYNLDELTVEEYRTLLRDDRYAPLRIWLAADRLFETDPDGGPRLRDGAGRRIAEAMGELLQYPRSSPIVVEGYATEGGVGRRMLDAHARARWSSAISRGRSAARAPPARWRSAPRRRRARPATGAGTAWR